MARGSCGMGADWECERAEMQYTGVGMREEKVGGEKWLARRLGRLSGRIWWDGNDEWGWLGDEMRWGEGGWWFEGGGGRRSVNWRWVGDEERRWEKVYLWGWKGRLYGLTQGWGSGWVQLKRMGLWRGLVTKVCISDQAQS